MLIDDEKVSINNIEEFSEVLSNLIVEKLENRVSLKYIEKDNSFYNIDEESWGDWNEDNLFKWTYEKEKWKLHIIDENLIIFLQKILSKSNKKLYKKFIKSLQSDAIVGLMYDSLEKLMLEEKDLEILDSLYCDDQHFQNKFNEFGIQYDVEKLDETMNKLDEHLIKCQYFIPLQLIPFATYALMNNPRVTKNTVNDVLNQTNALHLKWISETAPNPQSENKDNKIILAAQLSFDFYVSFLEKIIIPLTDKPYNASLNFYMFNQRTALYDVYLLSKEIFENSRLIDLQKIYPAKLYEVLDRNQKYRRKEQLVEGLVHLSQIDGMMCKQFMLKHHISTQIFKSFDLVELINWFLTVCKEKLREALELKHSNVNFNDFNVYSNLSNNYSPYNKIIKKISDNDFLYNESFEDTLNYIKYELYHYSYKAMYREKANV